MKDILQRKFVSGSSAQVIYYISIYSLIIKSPAVNGKIHQQALP